MNEVLKEALKSGLRTVVLAVIPVLVDSLRRGSVDFGVIGVTALISALLFIDSYLHESNKALPKKEQNDGLLGKKGLTGF